MNTDEILQLFKQDKLLVRAMSLPIRLRDENRNHYFDFTSWATELALARNADLTCASSTLLVSAENIPTYKNLGFIINSDKVEIVHVCERDSCSSGNIDTGNFFAAQTDLKTLPELAQRTRDKKLKELNEVNINIRNPDAFIGLFLSVGREGISKMPSFYTAYLLMAQEYYKMYAGIELPLFEYNAEKSSLSPLIISEKEKREILLQNKKTWKTLTIGYDASPLESRKTDFRYKTLYDNTGLNLERAISQLSQIKTERKNTDPSIQITQKIIENLIEK